MKKIAEPNHEALYADFRKIINSLNSSTTPQHIVATDRMVELLERKWDKVSKSNLDTKATIDNFAVLYHIQKGIVSRRFTIS
mgnify:CR=1 FL=1